MPKPKPRRRQERPRPTAAIVWPGDAEARYNISAVTRWRWEKTGRLPPRDFFIAGVAEGWRPETLDAADRGLKPAA